jgi:hypothetical protein
MNWKAELDALIEETMAMAKTANAGTIKPVVPLPLVERALAQPHRSTPIAPMIWPASERDQIKQRVSNFKAHQERLRQEREDFFTRTMTKARHLAKGRSY